MNKKLKEITLKGWMSRVLCAALATALGWFLLTRSAGDGLTRFSFDYPQLLRNAPPPTEAVIVKLDDVSHQALGRRHDEPWPRDVHAELIRKLTEHGAKLIVFDIVFETEGLDPAADAALASAIRDCNNVVLCGDLYNQENPGMEPVEIMIQPFEAFRTNAVNWGIARMPEDGDFGIRRQLLPREDVVTLAWAAAEALGSPVTRDRSDEVERWINYYGPRDTVPGISYYAALDPKNEAPVGFFEDKIVYVGQHFEIDFAAILKDDYITPYSRQADIGGVMPGVEIQANMLLNLLRNDWLVRMSPSAEIALIVVIGIGLSVGLHFIRPWLAVMTGAGATLLLIAAAWILYRHQNTWFAWTVPVLQIGLSTLWAATYNSARLYVDKRLLMQSISSHIAPGRVEQILKQEALLEPGGHNQQVSILFSDIAGFSGISEKLTPDELFELLNKYYATALESVHEQEGTVVQLIGDAIYAVWNAPLPQEDHKERACLAAMNLHQRLVKFDATVKDSKFKLHTRVGVHSGIATVGNLGSSKRFEYTAIGDSINLSSRLEGLNKHVGTDILATRNVQEAVEDKVVSRLVGHFFFKGFSRPVEVHEILGDKDIEEGTRAWRDKFDEALRIYRSGRIADAKATFERVIEMRRQAGVETSYKDEEEKGDGPSRLYLAEIEKLGDSPLPENWTGDIIMTEK